MDDNDQAKDVTFLITSFFMRFNMTPALCLRANIRGQIEYIGNDVIFHRSDASDMKFIDLLWIGIRVHDAAIIHESSSVVIFFIWEEIDNSQ